MDIRPILYSQEEYARYFFEFHWSNLFINIHLEMPHIVSALVYLSQGIINPIPKLKTLFTIRFPVSCILRSSILALMSTYAGPILLNRVRQFFEHHTFPV